MFTFTSEFYGVLLFTVLRLAMRSLRRLDFGDQSVAPKPEAESGASALAVPAFLALLLALIC